MSGIDDIIAKMRARKAEVARFVALHDGESFETVDRNGNKLIVHRDAHGWRFTYFNKREPTGHVYGRDYLDVVKIAVVDWGADLSKAKFQAVR